MTRRGHVNTWISLALGLLLVALVFTVTGLQHFIFHPLAESAYDLHVTDSQMRPDPNGVTPLGTFTVTIIPRMADDSIWETFEADATRIDIDEEACASLGVRYPARFAKVWEADLGKIARYQRLPSPTPGPIESTWPEPVDAEAD